MALSAGCIHHPSTPAYILAAVAWWLITCCLLHAGLIGLVLKGSETTCDSIVVGQNITDTATACVTPQATCAEADTTITGLPAGAGVCTSGPATNTGGLCTSNVQACEFTYTCRFDAAGSYTLLSSRGIPNCVDVAVSVLGCMSWWGVHWVASVCVMFALTTMQRHRLPSHQHGLWMSTVGIMCIDR
jgi:hypothetical protein